MINEPIEPSHAQRSKALAQAARDRIFRSFTNVDAARAAIPFELARVEDCSRPEERSRNEPATAEDSIRGRNHESGREEAGRIAPA
jgi:fibronectin type 3 domain-containing protein